MYRKKCLTFSYGGSSSYNYQISIPWIHCLNVWFLKLLWDLFWKWNDLLLTVKKWIIEKKKLLLEFLIWVLIFLNLLNYFSFGSRQNFKQFFSLPFRIMCICKVVFSAKSIKWKLSINQNFHTHFRLSLVRHRQMPTHPRLVNNDIPKKQSSSSPVCWSNELIKVTEKNMHQEILRSTWVNQE